MPRSELLTDEPSGDAAPLRVALACPGAGVEQRGFERIFRDLGGVVGEYVDVTLFKGGGPRSEREIVLPFLRRNGRFLRILPVHRLVGRTPIHAECLTFALALLPHLRSGRFDVVHVIDPPLARALYRLRAKLNLRFALLYTEATSMPPSDYPPCDMMHHIGQVAYDDAIAYGHSPEDMVVLPPGIHIDRFAPSAPREELRRAHGVPDSTFLVLYVGAINRIQKRLDYLIEEAAQVSGDMLVWIDGSMDQGDPTLFDLAKERLGDRVRFSRVPSDEIGDLYAMADVMVLSSVFEAFGLVLAEAMAAGAPTLMHDAPHFNWVAPNPACHINMREPGALAAKLAELRDDPAARDALKEINNPRERFDWKKLAPQYVDLYRRVARRRPGETGASAGIADRTAASKRSRIRAIARSWLPASLFDRLTYASSLAASLGANRRFMREHSDAATPPSRMMFAVFGHTSQCIYHDTGDRDAQEFVKILQEVSDEPSPTILDWGCGPGRVLRRLAVHLSGRSAGLHGVDTDAEAIEWCRAHIPGAEFTQISAHPPLPFPDDMFDAVWGCSMFTQLDERRQVEWAREILRVLRPGGVLVCTTYGDGGRHLLASIEERLRYNCGQVVVRESGRAGEGRCVAVHPPLFVRETLLREYEGVERRLPGEPDCPQDIWIARKPINSTT